jgi:hypothetical protein
MIGDILNKKDTLSSYQPSKDIIDITKIVKDDYSKGVDILQRSWTELNNRTIIEDANRGQMMFNGFVDTSIDDPNEAWKWRGTRSMARNKGIAMHAQLTSNFLLPLFQAQNENDEVDRDFSEVMSELTEWLAQPINSNYQSQFLQISLSMMYNPITYMGAEFCEVMQTLKDKNDNGEVISKEVVDEVLSGFEASIWGPTEVLLTNAYVRNIQKQKAIIKRRWVEYDEMEAKYHKHPNWVYVQEGIKSIYSDEDGLFYDIKDDDNETNLVAEEIWENRRQDLEIPFVNGIYLGDTNINDNPIKHRDNFNRPKYNVVPFGFMRVGEHFAYYKSMMNALQWDNMAYDAMSEIVFNRAILENEMPIAISGSDKVDSSVIFPNAVVAFEDKDTKISPLLPPSNATQGFNALRETEKSMSEGSGINETIAGQLPDASQKAFSVAQAQANAKKNIGAIGKSLAESLVMFGDLMKDIIINNITVPEVEELVGGRMKLKYKNFILNSEKSGETILDFDESLIGQEMTEDEEKEQNLMLLEKTGEKNQVLRRINPSLFAKFKYLTKIDIEQMFNKSNEFMQPLLTALKAQLINDPFIKQDKLTRKLLQSYFGSEAEELMKDEFEVIPGLPQQGNNQLANQVFNKQTAQAVNNQVT